METNILVLKKAVGICFVWSTFNIRKKWTSGKHLHPILTPANLCLYNWTASSEFGTYRLCEQRRFRRACASAQSRQNLRCSLIQAVSQEEPSDRKPDPWPLWMAGHAQLKSVMTECSKTQIRLTGLINSKTQVCWGILQGTHLCITKDSNRYKG